MQNRKDLILLHGAIGSQKQLDILVDRLRVNFNIYRFDFPGHGENANQYSQFSIHNFVNYLSNYILENKLNKPSVFGYSMGGFVALSLEAKEQLFSDIMTLNTKFQWDIETAQKEKKMFIPEAIEQKVPHFANKLKQVHGEENWTRLLEYHRNLMEDISINYPLPDYLLKRINTRVLISRSANDEMVTRIESENVVNLINNSSYFEIKNSRHAIEQIDIDVLINKMNEFFS